MIIIVGNTLTCPDCGGKLKYYDSVKRIVRIKGGKVRRIKIRRLICTNCGKSHRELPERILPYKQYEAEIINGVIQGTISSDDLEYEDFPCEMTMKRWKDSSAKRISQKVPCGKQNKKPGKNE